MSRFAYTIGTLVTSAGQYADMRRSFDKHGFTEADCEYVTVDNTSASAGLPQTDAYAGLNSVLDRAQAPYVILCHQDVLMLDDGRAELDRRLRDLTTLDPAWAVAGNAGGAGTRSIVRVITDKHGANQRIGEFPHRVMSVDENFIVVRRAARIGFSHDLASFHLYGADICLAADVMGYSAYVIDFHLNHLGASAMGPAFDAAEAAFRAKWRRALRDRRMQTTCTYLHLSGRSEPAIVTGLREKTHLRLARLGISLAKRRAGIKPTT